MSTDAGFAFRKTTWGMTREEVRQSEDTEFDRESSDALSFKTHILDLPCRLHYDFHEGRLVLGFYAVETNPRECFDVALKLQIALENKYGQPIEESDDWKSGKYKNQPEMWGQAIAEGQLEVYVSWQTESTQIELGIRAGGGDVIVTLFYYSSAYLIARTEHERRQLLKGTDDPENLANL